MKTRRKLRYNPAFITIKRQTEWKEKIGGYERTKLPISSLSKEEYEQYLKSTEWQEKAKKFMKYFNSRCIYCNKNNRHHFIKIYHRNNRNIKNETINDVVASCPSCYNKMKNIKWRRRIKN
jgi:hypothetical protein